MSFFSAQRGFSLIELLTTIAILGVLATVLATVLNPITQFERARDTQRKYDMQKIVAALEQYRNLENHYPSSLDYLTDCPAGICGTDIKLLKSLPTDPTGTGEYKYIYTPDNSSGVYASYTLTDCLEDKHAVISATILAVPLATCSSKRQLQFTSE